MVRRGNLWASQVGQILYPTVRQPGQAAKPLASPFAVREHEADEDFFREHQPTTADISGLYPPQLLWIPTPQSSNVARYAYDRKNQILYLVFKNKDGSEVSGYEYYSVPENVYAGMLKASSKGRYLWLQVKKKGFRYSKMW